MKKALLIIGIIVLVAIVGGVVFVNTRTVSDGSDYLPPREAIEAVTGLPVTEEGGIKRFGDAWVEKRGADYLLHLSGTPYEMGYQHGVLMADEITNGAVPVFADPVSHNASFAGKPAWLRKLLLTYLEFSVYGPIERNTPREYLEEIKGIADGAGLDFREVFIANFLSDLTMAMTPGVINKKAAELGIGAECSAFVAAGDAVEGGALIFGRNTDYSGQGRWGPYQTIFFYKPAGGLSYVNVGSAGLIKANSAMNEAGIVVSGHFMAFEGAEPAGVSFTVLENEIMRKAHTLDEAIALLEDAHRGGSFGLIIADGARKEAAVVESTPERLGVRRMENGTIVLTNFATTEELKPVDLLLRYNVLLRNVMGRYERLSRLIELHRGAITPALSATFMSDHVDVITGAERGTGITICSDNNVTSAVFVPGSGLFWVAGGSEPACINDYVGYDFPAELAGDAGRSAARSPFGLFMGGPREAGGLRALHEGLYRLRGGFLRQGDRPRKSQAGHSRRPRRAGLCPYGRYPFHPPEGLPNGRGAPYRRAHAAPGAQRGRHDAPAAWLGIRPFRQPGPGPGALPGGW